MVVHDEMVLYCTLWTDEAIFHLNGQVNRQDTRLWSTDNPHFYVEKEMKSKGLMVWAGIYAGGIIGPFFITGKLNGPKYLRMLKEQVLPLIRRNMLLNGGYWMQDGAPPHFAKEIRDFLDQTYPGRWIGRSGPILWPPRSPDMTPCDFFLWAHIKRQVYARRPETLDELRLYITEAFDRLDVETCERVCVSVSDRFIKCLEKNGGHFE